MSPSYWKSAPLGVCHAHGCLKSAALETRSGEEIPRAWCHPHVRERKAECLAAWLKAKTPGYNVILFRRLPTVEDLIVDDDYIFDRLAA